jgi:hypothetical protein
MIKMKVTFEFIKEEGEWPICIAKTKKGTFICLEYLPRPQSYYRLCQDFLQAFLFGYNHPPQWQEVKRETRVKRASHMKKKEKVTGILVTEKLSF